MRIEIQALRALALTAVLVAHCWPGSLTGGYLGVDVFFVLSGFLITGLLVREAEATGAVRLADFWARRARRLLPASMLVLAACALLSRLMLRSHWEVCFKQIAAAAVYGHNWLLRAYQIDYWRPDIPSPVLHFWSLSMEEQFYAVWPLLVAACAAAAARRGPRSLRAALGAALGGVTAASFVHGLRAASYDPPDAYLSTAARAWEFGAGGLLALAPEAAGLPALRACAAWLGLAGIVACSAAFGPSQQAPRLWTLLPVAATAAVIWAGAPRARWAPTRLYELRPVQALGGLSYSAYLWHWPVLILLPQALGRPLGAWERGAALAFALALAQLSKTLVEDPMRFRSPLASRAPRASFAAAGLAMAAVAALCAQPLASLGRAEAAAEAQARALLDQRAPCLGAAARDPEAPPCRNPALERLVLPLPTPSIGGFGLYDALLNAPADQLEVSPFGAPAEGASATIALIGDSHASTMAWALQPLAQKRGWHGYLLARCAVTRTPRPGRPDCPGWNRLVLRWLREHTEVSQVFTAARAFPRAAPEAETRGFYDELRRFPRSVRRIVVLRDSPMNLDPDCAISALDHGRDPGLCRDERRDSLAYDGLAAAATQLGGRAAVLDFTPHYCDERWCYHVIGGLRVHRDGNHLAVPWVLTLAPYLERAYDRLPPPGQLADRRR